MKLSRTHWQHRKCGHYSSVGVVDGLWVSGHGGYRVHPQCKDCRKWEESFCFAPPDTIVGPCLRRVVVVLQQPGHCTFLQTTDMLVLYAFTHMNISTIRVIACFMLHVQYCIWPNLLVMRWRGWRWWDTLAQPLRSEDATILRPLQPADPTTNGAILVTAGTFCSRLCGAKSGYYWMKCWETKPGILRRHMIFSWPWPSVYCT